MTTGYLHSGYSDSLSEFGTPYHLVNSGGWILLRSVPGTPYRDAIGPYPLFACKKWRALKSDLDELKGRLISIALVTDPFGNYNDALLQACFPDVMIPFKTHYIAELHKPRSQIVSKHHRYYARKTLDNLQVEACQHPSRHMDDWLSLYSLLINRHNLTGIKAFSRLAFKKQIQIPGLVMFRATSNKKLVGMHLWYVQGETAYSHLAASNEQGYNLMASYALHWFAFEYFSTQVRWLDFGAGAGLGSGTEDGLSRFKRGWSTDSRTTYFCGRISDHQKYRNIIRNLDLQLTEYFPAYRVGEFG